MSHSRPLQDEGGFPCIAPDFDAPLPGEIARPFGVRAGTTSMGREH